MTTLKAAAQKALAAIENGESFDHMDSVIAPVLRAALSENERKTAKSGAEFGQHDIRGRVLMRLRKGPLSTDDLAKDLRAARSTVANALTELHRKKRIVIISWAKTGSIPARVWGLGDRDADRPPLITREAKNERKRELRKIQKAQRESMKDAPPSFTPRRDPAASWF